MYADVIMYHSEMKFSAEAVSFYDSTAKSSTHRCCVKEHYECSV